MENYLIHYGIKGQQWGKQNGPPYPLSDSQMSSKEKKMNLEKESFKTYFKSPYKISKEEREKRIHNAELFSKIYTTAAIPATGAGLGLIARSIVDASSGIPLGTMFNAGLVLTDLGIAYAINAKSSNKRATKARKASVYESMIDSGMSEKEAKKAVNQLKRY